MKRKKDTILKNCGTTTKRVTYAKWEYKVEKKETKDQRLYWKQ